MSARGSERGDARTIAVTGATLGAAMVLVPSFLVLRPNRFVDGRPAGALEALGGWAWTLLTLWLLAAAVALSPLPSRARGSATGLAAGAAVVLATWRAAEAAVGYTAAHGEVARVSFGYGYALSLLACYLVVFAATAWLPRGWPRAAVAWAPVLGVAALLATGGLDALSVLREYQNNTEGFAAQLRLQLLYTVGATAAGVAVGLPLGLLSARRPRAEPAVFSTLNVFEVLPVLAFIGLLNPVLTWLSERVPPLAALGVRGVGWAPVFLVLSAYATYPVARNAHAALTTLDPAVLDAARGVGMGRRRRLAEVELPLALPVIVAGIRIAVVQTAAGAIIAGLVGGGGLGTFVFLGASQTALDLVLVGTVPIVVMALLFDRITRLTETLVARWSLHA